MLNVVNHDADNFVVAYSKFLQRLCLLFRKQPIYIVQKKIVWAVNAASMLSVLQVYYIHQLVFLYVKLDSCIIGLLVKALHWGDWVWFEICISYCIGSIMDDVLLGQNCSIFAVKLPSCRKSHQSLCIKIRIKVRSLVSGIFCCHCYNTVTFVMWLAYFRLLPRKCLHTYCTSVVALPESVKSIR